MSEYWVSKKKYFCKYCEIYIADDVPSRQQHENGLRHQGNRERFIRNIYKASEKKKKDLEEEKRELARIDQVSRIFHDSFSWSPTNVYRLRMLLSLKTSVQVMPALALLHHQHLLLLPSNRKSNLQTHLLIIQPLSLLGTLIQT